MKHLLLLALLLLTSTFSAFGQLNSDHNSIRTGDVLIKQQVEYKDPGKAGANQIWDFSKLESINDQYTLSYSLPPLEGDSVYLVGNNRFKKKNVRKDGYIVGTEHNTMYYFRQTLDSLLLIGHENAVVRLNHSPKIAELNYPLNYGNRIQSRYQSKGLYSQTVRLESEGEVTVCADAYGVIILPSGDTISPVLRVKTAQTTLDTSKGVKSDFVNDKGRLQESYKWYSKGYRYPIFETIQCINLNDSSELFATAFFFPPQEHLYLDTDPENLALLEELWEYTDLDIDTKKIDFPINENSTSHSVSFNPETHILNIEYTLNEDTSVNIIICAVDGKVVKNIFKKQQNAGNRTEQIDCSNLLHGAYFVKLVAGSVVINDKFLKK